MPRDRAQRTTRPRSDAGAHPVPELPPAATFSRPPHHPAHPPPARELPRATGAASGRCGFFSRCSSSRLFAEFIANDRPIVVRYDGGWYFPVFADYPETTFGGDFPTPADYRDPAVKKLIAQKGWMVWPLIPFSYDTINYDLPSPAPVAAVARQLARHRRPGPRRAGAADLRLSHLGAVRPGPDRCSPR